MERGLEQAYEHERQGRLLQAIDSYEGVAAEGPLPKLPLLRLLFLYALLADDGYAWAHGVTSEEIRRYEPRLAFRLAEAAAAVDPDPEIAATTLLIRCVFLNSLDFGDVADEVAARERGGHAPTAMVLRFIAGREPRLSDADRTNARRLLESLDGDESQRAQYIRAVLRLA